MAETPIKAPLFAESSQIDHGIPTGVMRTPMGAIERAMQAIAANELKTRGIGAISQALQHEREVGLPVRGQLRSEVMELAEFHRQRECELDLALQRCRVDRVGVPLAAGVGGRPSLSPAAMADGPEHAPQR